MAKILAVDDEAKILQIIRKALEKDGHIVQTVQDGEVVRQMELSRYDLILLDVMMPGIDGFTLCREIRETVDCPIVFLTAKTLEEDLMAGLGSGADDYICKPFGLGELRARVQAHLRREQREKKQVFAVSGLHFYMQAKKVMAKDQKVPLTKASIRFVNIWRFITDRHCRGNRSMRQYLAMKEKVTPQRSQNILKISERN